MLATADQISRVSDVTHANDANSMNRYVKRMIITPTNAETLLAKRRPGQIKRFDRRAAMSLKDRIERFGYKECNDIFVVDREGFFANGQHRAWCIKELGITVYQHVAFNAPVEEFEMTDAHRTRNRAAQMMIAGVENAKMVAPCLLACYEFAHSRFKCGDSNYMRNRLSESAMISDYQKSTALQSCFSSMTCSKNRALLKTLGGFYKAVFSSVDNELWEEFFAKLQGELPTTKADVEFQLRSRLMEQGTNKLHALQRDALIVIAWNHRVANRKIKVLAWDKAKQGFPKIDGTTPARFASIYGIPIVEEYIRTEQ
jgi:hypothetical protein